MFEVGELIRRKTISDGKTQALCVIVKKSEDNYIIYNNSFYCRNIYKKKVK